MANHKESYLVERTALLRKCAWVCLKAELVALGDLGERLQGHEHPFLPLPLSSPSQPWMEISSCSL